jgi:hypothetical protein
MTTIMTGGMAIRLAHRHTLPAASTTTVVRAENVGNPIDP